MTAIFVSVTFFVSVAFSRRGEDGVFEGGRDAIDDVFSRVRGDGGDERDGGGSSRAGFLGIARERLEDGDDATERVVGVYGGGDVAENKRRRDAKRRVSRRR